MGGVFVMVFWCKIYMPIMEVYKFIPKPVGTDLYKNREAIPLLIGFLLNLLIF